jgi:hypothetical protein
MTDEDLKIWARVCARFCPDGPDICLEWVGRMADSADARRMCRILYRGCRFCGEPPHPSLWDVLHLRDCVYATTGARLIIWEGQR